MLSFTHPHVIPLSSVGENGEVLNNVHATLFYVMKSGQ